MFVLLIQPANESAPSPRGRPGEPPAPPWDLVCLHSFLQARTGFRPILFDARLYANWPEALENAAPAGGRDVVAVVRSRIFELPAVRRALTELAERLPAAMRVLCGSLPAARPEECARLPGVDAVIAGDSEPALRFLLENRHAPARLQAAPGIAMPGRTTAPLWWPDLNQLPAIAWETLPWRDYVTHAQGGMRALIRVSRGHSHQPADRAWGGGDEPLRLWDFSRLAASFGRCAHLGVVENLLVDPPGIWTPDRLQAWCDALIAARNTHPWSLQLLPRIISADEAYHLREAGCRRMEIVLPSSRLEELERYGLPGDKRHLQVAVRSMAQDGLEVLVRCWVGGPGEGRREARRLRQLAGTLGYPPIRFQPFPLALDAPLIADSPRDAKTPDLESWISDPTPRSAFWGGAEGRARACALGEKLDYEMKHRWAPRFHRWRIGWRSTSFMDEIEQRATEPLQTPAPFA